MDYFKILNLKKEPFSNSPEPEFFFQSRQHLGCLQKLELAIRLRRGLNVVIGDVGIGKTTLCRQLIVKFAATEKDKQQIETHLFLDPSFSNALEFLLTVTTAFGLPKPNGNFSEWQLKENIKNYLFEKGIHEGKTVVLIIDEGQKLPAFCIEILREFLNYETNEYKLLQIVIFAQREFEQIIKAYENFADRVNQYISLEPLNVTDTKRMIEFRMAKASGSDVAPPLFTYFGILAVYIATRGYPRKIITLCHQVILALIIQNRLKAGWFLIHACARRGLPEKSKRLRWATATAMAAVLVVFIVVALATNSGRIVSRAALPQKSLESRTAHQGVVPSPAVNQKLDDTQQVKSTPVAEPTPKVVQDVPLQPKKMPDSLGQLIVKKGGTLWWMFSDVYGVFDTDRFKLFARANPHITNINYIIPGDIINFPALKLSSHSLPPGKYWIQVASRKNLQEGYQLLKDYSDNVPNIWLFPYWNKQEGMIYAILLRDGFNDEESALRAMKQLPVQPTSDARVLSKWDNDVVFFASL
jgi:general secretion pathway protein A